MQTAFDAFKSNQPATQQAVSQGPQAGLRYLAGLQAQANQQQAQQAQPQALPSTTVLQQLLQKLGQNHGIMAQLPASIDIASAPTQPAMATGGLVSLAAGGPIAFSGGGDVPEFDEELEGFAGGGIASIQARMEQSAAQKQANLEQWQLAQERKRARMQGAPVETASAGEETSAASDGIASRMGRTISESPLWKAASESPIGQAVGKVAPWVGKAGSWVAPAAIAADPDIRAAIRSPMILSKLATNSPLTDDEREAVMRVSAMASKYVGGEPLDADYDASYNDDDEPSELTYYRTTEPSPSKRRELFSAPEGNAKEFDYYKPTKPLIRPHANTGMPSVARISSDENRGIQSIRTPFVGPTKPTESPVHEPVAKAEPSAAAKQGVKAVSPTEHAKQIEKKAEAPKGKEPQGAVPEEKQYEFDQHRDEYRDDHQPQGQTVSQPTDREYPPAPETSGIASVTPEEMIQHLQRLGGGGYQEDPEVLQMRNEQLESAKANKWANSIAGLIGGIYGGHSPYASENVARGIMTALGQYQAGTQAEDAIRSGIMGSKEAAQKSQAASQQHWMDKFIEAQLAKGRDQASIVREMLSGDARLGAAETRAKAAQEAAQQRHIDAVARSNQSRSEAEQKLVADAAKIAFTAVENYNKNYVKGIPSTEDMKRVFLATFHKIAPNINLTDEEVASMLGSPPPTGSPGNPTATYGSSSSQVPYDED